MTWYREISDIQQPFDMKLDSTGRAKVGFNISIVKRPSTPLIEELVSILVAAGVGTSAGNIFAASSADIPTGSGPYLTIEPTGGLFAERTHNETSSPAYQRPTAQIVVRAKTYSAARTMANAAYTALVNVRNQTITP